MDPDLQHCSNLSALSFKPDPNPSFAVLRIRIILIRIRIHDVKKFCYGSESRTTFDTDPDPGKNDTDPDPGKRTKGAVSRDFLPLFFS